MAELTIIFWRDIPAQLIARAGRTSAKRELPARFQQAIDQAAMRAGAKDSDAYLSSWRRGAPEPCGDDLEAEIARAVEHVLGAYDEARLKRLVDHGGFEAAISDGDPLVVFVPSGKRGRFAKGTSLLEAARDLGVDLDSVCGGRGLCGRCQIDIQDGQDRKRGLSSSAGHVSGLGPVEERYFSLRGRVAGLRLGCQARIEGDLIIDVPASSQLHRPLVRKQARQDIITLDPPVVLRLVEVDPPSLEKSSSDAARLLAALAAQWGMKEAVLPPALLPSLQGALRAGKWQVTIALRGGRDIVAIYPGLKEQIAGVAIDIGSTTIAAHLCDLGTGDILASAGVMNPQIRFGEDLMSRVAYAMTTPGGGAAMSAAVRRAVNELIAGLVSEVSLSTSDIAELVIVGNPVMHHLMLGIDPSELGAAPFALALDQPLDVPARDIGLDAAPGAFAHFLPCIAGHVGADASAMVLAETPHLKDEITLLVDVGTNAEIVLGNKDRLLACSSPTGPAFEGAELSCGQRAAPGAIERIAIDPETFEPRFKVIGIAQWSDEAGFEAPALATGVTGLCGSGIIEAVAELAIAGLITPDGAFNPAMAARTRRLIPEGRSYRYLILAGAQEIFLTQTDIRAVQLAKAALHAGCKLLMNRLGVDRVDRIRLAGAFGAHIDPLHALALGLIPDCAPAQVSAAGNSAGHGARIALLNAASRQEITEVVRGIEKIETALDPLFQSEFVAAMAIPHASDPYLQTRLHVKLPEAAALQGAQRRHAGRRRSSS